MQEQKIGEEEKKILGADIENVRGLRVGRRERGSKAGYSWNNCQKLSRRESEGERESRCKLVVGFGRLNLILCKLAVGFGQLKLRGCKRARRKRHPLNCRG